MVVCNHTVRFIFVATTSPFKIVFQNTNKSHNLVLGATKGVDARKDGLSTQRMADSCTRMNRNEVLAISANGFVDFETLKGTKDTGKGGSESSALRKTGQPQSSQKRQYISYLSSDSASTLFVFFRLGDTSKCCAKEWQSLACRSENRDLDEPKRYLMLPNQHSKSYLHSTPSQYPRQA